MEEENKVVYSTKRDVRLQESFGYKVNKDGPKKEPYLGADIIRAFSRAGWFSRYGAPNAQPRQGGLAPCLCGPKDKIVKPLDTHMTFAKKANPQLQNRTERKENLAAMFGLTA